MFEIIVDKLGDSYIVQGCWDGENSFRTRDTRSLGAIENLIYHTMMKVELLGTPCNSGAVFAALFCDPHVVAMLR